MKKIIYLILVVFFTSCSINNEKDISLYDFGTVSFEEPFRGILKNSSLLKKSLNIPPFKWFAPDTLTLQKTFIYEFNEDALRSQASATLFFADSLCQPIDGVLLYAEGGSSTNNQITINADSLSKTLTVVCRVDPKLGEREIKGNVFVSCQEIDQVNSIFIHQDRVNIAEWTVAQEFDIPWMLWFLWALVLFVVVLALKTAVDMVIIILPLITLTSPGAMQGAICALYNMPNFLFNIVFKCLPSKLQTFLKTNMPKKSDFKVGKVQAMNVEQQKKLEEIRRKTGKYLRYKYGEVDFTPVAEYQVKLPGSLHDCIPDTLDPRSKVSKAQEIAGKRMLQSADGRKKIAKYLGKSTDNLTLDDFFAWKDDRLNIGKPNHNPFTPHETIDGKYIQFVPKKYHDAGNGWYGFSHNGGVSLLKQIRVFVSEL